MNLVDDAPVGDLPLPDTRATTSVIRGRASFVKSCRSTIVKCAYSCAVIAIMFACGCVPFRERLRSPEEVEASYVRGGRYYAEGSYSQAINELLRVAQEPSSPYADDAQYLLAKCYYALGDYYVCAKEAKELNDRFPDSPLVDSAALLAAESYSAAGELLKAGEAYLAVLKVTTSDEKAESAMNELSRLSANLSVDELYSLRKESENSKAEPIVLLAIAEKEMRRGDSGATKNALDRLLRIGADTETTERARHLLRLVKTPDAVRIGLIAPLTGEHSIYGEALRKGVELAMVQAGRLGLVLLDSEGDPIEVVAGVKRLVREYNVLAIIGPVFTKTVIPAAIAADELDTPLLSPTATDERISDLGDCVFQLGTGLQTQADLLASHSVRRMGFEKFAIIHPEDAYGRALSARFSSEVLRLGGEISAIVGYERGMTDFKDEIDVLKEDTVDAIFIPAYSDDVIMIATQLRYYEVETPLLGADGWKSSTLLALAREYVEGSVFTAFELDVDSAQADRVFSLKYREQYGEDPLKQSAQGFDAGHLIVEAVSAGIDTPGRLRDYLNSRPPSVGASGLVYTARNRTAEVVRLYTIRKGRIERIE